MSKMTDAISWFKAQFGNKIETATQNTPFSVDMLTAIALQETYYIWGRVYQTKPIGEVLALCCGDTIDHPGRSAFPRTRARLEEVSRGDEMFAIARERLVEMAKTTPGYKKAVQNENKFCHGFGIFQYDLQFFKDDPDYFLERRWSSFDNALGKCIEELKRALKKAYGPNKQSLTDKEMVYVCIAYNKGSVDTSKSFKQGHKDDEGVYYGEYIEKYLALAKTVP